MRHYYIEPRLKTYVKGYRCCHLPEIYLTNMGKNYHIATKEKEDDLKTGSKKIVHKRKQS